MMLKFRPATIADLAVVLDWVTDSRTFLSWAGPKVRYPADAAMVWSDMQASADNTFGIFLKDGYIAGFGQILLRDNGRVHLARLIVDPGLRRQGLGRLLCHQLMKTAKRFAVREFTLNVYMDNRAALALYRSLGFKARKRQDREDVLYMRMAAPQDR